MQMLAIRHIDPRTRQPYGDTFLSLSPVCDHGTGLRFLLDGLRGWPLAVGVFDPDVNTAAVFADSQRAAGADPPADAEYPPQVAAALFYSAAKRREQITADIAAQMVEQGVEGVDVLVR